MVPVLGYWNTRGIAEMSRLLLCYNGVKFVDKQYSRGPAPHFDGGSWLKEKFNLGLDFPNLPYFIDGDFKLTQSMAILEYIADKHNMVPQCKKRKAELRMVNNDIIDFRSSFETVCYSPEFDILVVPFKENLPNRLNMYENYLGDKQWISGENISFPDFNLCEFLNQLRKFDSKSLDGFPKLKAYSERFENLPKIKEYMGSEEFKSRPCNNKQATWRGDH